MDGLNERETDRLAYMESTLKFIIASLQKESSPRKEIVFQTEAERFTRCEEAIDRFLQQYTPPTSQ